MQQVNRKSSETTNVVSEDLKNRLGDLKEKNSEIPITTYRFVNLVTSSCCGCGCHNIDIRRKVSRDSPLEDGDYVSELLETDEIL